MSIAGAATDVVVAGAKEALPHIGKFMGDFSKRWLKEGTSEVTIKSVKQGLEALPAKDAIKQMGDLNLMTKGLDNPATHADSIHSFDSYSTALRGAQQAEHAGDAIQKRVDSFKAKALYSTDMNRSGTGGKVSTEEKASMFASPEERTQFNRRYEDISFESPFAPHHLTPLKTGAQINNRHDSVKVWQEINKISPRQYAPGNTPKNLIASMHRKNAAFIQSGKDSIIQQKPEWKYTKQPYTWTDPYMGEMTSTPDRILKDISKDAGNAPYGEVKNWSSIGLPENGIWPHNGKKVTVAQKTVAWNNRYKYHGLNRKKIKFDPEGDILGSDHVEIGHRATDMHPAVQKMEDLLNDQQRYLSLPPEEAAKIIEPGLRVSNNIFININKLRLDLIKEKLGFLVRTGVDKNGRPKFKKLRKKIAVDKRFETEHIINWIKNNQRESAALGWKELSGDLNKMLKWLEVDPGKTSDEFNTVFSAELEP